MDNRPQQAASFDILHFDFSKMDEDQIQAVFEAEKALQRAGVYFGTDAGLKDGEITCRNWFLGELNGATLIDQIE